MLCFCLVSMTLLRGSYGVQNEFLGFGNNCRFEGEAGSNEGPDRQISIPHSQDLSHPLTLRSRDQGLPVGQTGDHLWQPTASSYASPQFAPRWSGAGPTSPNHLLKNFPPGQVSQPRGHPNLVPQQPKNGLEVATNYVLHAALAQPETLDRIGSFSVDASDSPLVPAHDLTRGAYPNFASAPRSSASTSSTPDPNLASYIARPQGQRETLNWLESLLFEEDDHPLKLTVDPSGRVGPNFAPVPDSSESTNYPSWITVFQKLQDKLNAGSDAAARQTQGSSTSSSSTHESNMAVSGGRSRKNIQVPMRGSKRMRTLDPAEVPPQQQLDDPLIQSDMTSLSPKDPTNDRSHHVEAVSPSPKNRIYEFTPATYRGSEVRLSDYAPMLWQATGFQRADYSRMKMLTKSVTKWLPVYAAAFTPTWKSPEMEAKLAILFEHLWLINTWLLLSFHHINVEDEIHHPGQDEMMTWVANQLLSTLPTLTSPDQELPVYHELQARIVKYLITPRIPIDEKTTGRICNRLFEIETENVLACEMAVYILEAYYKINNWDRYQEAFSEYGCIFGRLYTFTKRRTFGHKKKWKEKHEFEKVVMVPWSDKKPQQKSLHTAWEAWFKKKAQEICENRFREIELESEKLKYSKGK